MNFWPIIDTFNPFSYRLLQVHFKGSFSFMLEQSCNHASGISLCLVRVFEFQLLLFIRSYIMRVFSSGSLIHSLACFFCIWLKNSLLTNMASMHVKSFSLWNTRYSCFNYWFYILEDFTIYSVQVRIKRKVIKIGSTPLFELSS